MKPISAGRDGRTKPLSRNPIKCTGAVFSPVARIVWRTLTCTTRLRGNVQEDPGKTTMYLTLWPHQIYYPVPEEYGAPRLDSADWTPCFCHWLFTEGNSAYCAEAQGHQGCLGGMFVCRNTNAKNRDMLLWSLNWGLPTMPNAFRHMCTAWNSSVATDKSAFTYSLFCCGAWSFKIECEQSQPGKSEWPAWLS